MPYPTLEKLFYADTTSDRFANHERLLQSRLSNESTFRTGIQLEYGELFLAVPRELSRETEHALRRERRVSALWRTLPPVALDAYIRSLILDEVVYSNEMEGVHSTRREIEIALDRVQAATQGAQGNNRLEHTPFVELARLYLNLTKAPSMPCSLEDIRAIYDSVVADAIDPKDLPGDALFRSGQVVVENERGKVIHREVSPEAEIERMMTQWLALSRDEEIPELYSALMCHFLFGYIHPFYDGNGRTGRYLLALHLSSPLSQPTALSLSRVIAENKAAYYKAFDTTERKLNHTEGTHFVLELLNLIGLAQEDLIVDLEGKRSALDTLNERLNALEGKLSQRECSTLYYATQMQLYNSLQETKLDDLSRYLEVSKPTARKTLAALCNEHGLMERVSQRPPIYKLTQKGVDELGLAGV